MLLGINPISMTWTFLSLVAKKKSVFKGKKTFRDGVLDVFGIEMVYLLHLVFRISSQEFLASQVL